MACVTSPQPVSSGPAVATRVPRETDARTVSRTGADSVDLMEYQAKELFAKHGVVTTLGVVAVSYTHLTLPTNREV